MLQRAASSKTGAVLHILEPAVLYRLAFESLSDPRREKGPRENLRRAAGASSAPGAAPEHLKAKPGRPSGRAFRPPFSHSPRRLHLPLLHIFAIPVQAVSRHIEGRQSRSRRLTPAKAAKSEERPSTVLLGLLDGAPSFLSSACFSCTSPPPLSL